MLPSLHEVLTLSFVDHHCHSLRRTWASVGEGVPDWRRCFTEATDDVTLARHVPGLLSYQRFLTATASRLGLGPDASTASRPSSPAPAGGPGCADLERRVAARRDELASADPAGYLQGLLDDAGVSAMLVDTGYGAGDTLALGELTALTGLPTREVVRIERVAEALLEGGGAAARDLDHFADEFEDRLATAIDGGAVALKSVAAYRAGLALPRPSVAEVRQAWTDLDRHRQSRRLDDRILVAFLLWRSAELAGRRGVPLQIHTGLGDRDLDINLADPALLRPLLVDPSTRGCPIVLLHCYPYVAKAAYLASVYPQVWMDLSLAVPLAEPLAAGLVREALGLCPLTKLLAATDGHSYPEMHWWGAVSWRRALEQIPEATAFSDRVFAGNAAELYRLST